MERDRLERHEIGSGALRAAISVHGAELQSLRDASGAEWLWQAGPAWPRHAPVLFPIVGRLPGDTLLHAGETHRMTQHGFARDRRFTWLALTDTACALRLTDDAETRAAYPFPFTLDVAFAVAESALACTVTVANTGEAPLPFSVGAHPAFAWPLPRGGAREEHGVTFLPDAAAPSGTLRDSLPVRRLSNGLLDRAETLPLRQGRLRLEDELFRKDALVMTRLPAHALRYDGPGGAMLEMVWEGYEDFGLWSKPGAEFLCLEPWAGYASPLGWDGEFAGKPGVISLEPGRARRFHWTVTLRPAGA